MMTDIVLQYKPLGLFNITYKRKMPQRWDDLSPHQLITISEIYEKNLADHVVVSRMLNIPRFFTKRLHPFQLFCTVDTLDFISQFKPCDNFIIKNIQHLKAPKPKLQDVTWGQFIFVDSYYNNHVSTNNPETLNKFITALYTTGPFNKDMVTQNINIAKELPEQTKQAISINYRLVLEWLMSKYPTVFKKPKEDDKGDKFSAPDWVKIHDSIVGDDIVNSDRYTQLPVHDVFRLLTRKIKENVKRT